jgi:hypothetical protein
MIRGLPASIIAHAAVLGMTYVSLPYFGTRIYVEPVQAVAVEFAELGEINNIAPQIRDELEEEAIPEEMPDEEVPEDPAEDELPEAEQDVSDTKAAPIAEEDPEDLLPDFEEEKDTEEPEETPEEKPEPKPKPAPKPPADPLADFLNQSETTFKSEIETRKKQPEPKPLPVVDKPKTAVKDAPKPVARETRRGAGARTANTARIESLIVSRIRNECWAGVDDLPYPETLNVQMKLEVNLNGTVADLRLISPTRRPLGNSPMGTAVDRALRAVNKCAPYRLPKEDYDQWKEMNIYLGLGFTKK